MRQTLIQNIYNQNKSQQHENQDRNINRFQPVKSLNIINEELVSVSLVLIMTQNLNKYRSLGYPSIIFH